MIVKHLCEGKAIDRTVALMVYDVKNLTAVIAKLRQEGYPIKTAIQFYPNGKTFTYYHISSH
jgi:hypothetical protein